MKINSIVTLIIIVLITIGCSHEIKDKPAAKENNSFSFVFMTDIHLQPESRAIEGFEKAIDTVNKLNPDFVITGGDLVMDVLGQGYERSDMLYNLYRKTTEKFAMPVYNTMGNHEIFGIYDESGVNKDHPEYGEKMYEKRLGKRFYSFDHKGWHFMILDGIEDTKKSSYIGMVDSTQMQWIKDDLNDVPAKTPVAISVHIPFITAATQLESGSLEPNQNNIVVSNAKEVLDLYKGHNLKLVLQGHLHFLEDIYANGIHFITGGAVSARWWSGQYHGLEEGFVIIRINGENLDWDYIDFGWEVKAE
jgi:3',5'-cyclic AMP phosphodiesterase CpdA